MEETADSDTSKAVIEFVLGKGWIQCYCESCGRIFFVKPSSKMSKLSCAWGKCSAGSYPFQTFLKRKKMVTPQEISTIIDEFFRSLGFATMPSMNIANFEGRTDLVIAGVQMFDDVIHRNQYVREEKIFVAQPCVRMQFQSHIQSHEGTSTSFVNVCTEKMDAGLSEHLQTADQWCSLFSKLGLHMNDFAIAMRTSVNDWGTGKFAAHELFFVYGGLELGDAAYRVIPQPTRASLSLSDIGFGLERIVWAMNKTISYFDTITPLTLAGPREMLDSCRTLALLALCGVQASNKGPGLQFRRFAKVISEKYYREDIFQILRYYFDYWSHFIKPSISKESAVRFFRLEVDRFINLKVCEELRLPPPRNETTEEYFHRLVYSYNIDIYALHEAIKICKT